MKDIFVDNFESELFTTAFKKYFSEISDRERNWPLLFKQMNAEKDVTKAIMRLDGDIVVGFIMFCKIKLECLFFYEEMGYIREFWVDPEYRKSGHGKELLAIVEEYFCECGVSQIALTAAEELELFYAKQGYIKSSVLKKDGEFDKVFVKTF